ncbi:MAG: hypothetical protein ABI640_12805 [Gammaproteobacteria bacterium]
MRACFWLALFAAAPVCAQLPPPSELPPSALSATAFPSSDAVTHEYPSDAERLAALAVLLDLLQFKTDDRSPLALERQTDYRRTIARLDPPRATDDQRAAARTLRVDESFQNAVVTEFLPAYATEAAHAAAIPRRLPVVQKTTAVLWTTLTAALVAALLVPIVASIRSRR